MKNKRVLVTGHTGFKGSWLSLWLKELGATVSGYSLDPPTQPSLFELLQLEKEVEHHRGDICDFAHLKQVIQDFKPHLIFHLAAQPIVLRSYEQPKETFDVNAGGTVNLLEAVRIVGGVEALVLITTDKCYDNKEWVWGYREEEPLGGKDPYSASKAMAELAAAAYRNSFFEKGTLIATVRAGNIVGGGDFAENRLVPDAMRALSCGQVIPLRNPHSIRPWLYVLDALNGYLMVAEKLLNQERAYASAWNFGPREVRGIRTEEIVEKILSLWGSGTWRQTIAGQHKKEMCSLRLNWDKAASYLEWAPLYGWEEALENSVRWYRAFFEGTEDLRRLSLEQIHHYCGEEKCVSQSCL